LFAFQQLPESLMDVIEGQPIEIPTPDSGLIGHDCQANIESGQQPQSRRRIRQQLDAIR
jgi:hypothetical protein